MLSLALLAGGVVLIFFGINEAESFGSQVSHFFTGSPTDKAIWMLVIGVVLAVAGLGGTVFGGKQKGA